MPHHLINECVNENIKTKSYTYNNNKYEIISHDKNAVDNELIVSGKCIRSLITHNGKVLCVSPFKSVAPDDFDWGAPQDIHATKFIDGTMINLFYNDAWVISTRSTVGGNVSFFRSETYSTFKTMFEDAVIQDYNDMESFYNELNKEYSYSFVLQHPSHRIVTPIENPNVYLVGIYKVDGYNVEYIDPFVSRDISIVKRPQIIMTKEPLSKASLSMLLNDDMFDWKMMGIHLQNKRTGIRTKLRNPKYEKMRMLRGNQPKLQYRFIEMKQNNDDIATFLQVWPEYKSHINNYTEKLSTMCKTIYELYVKRYITHEINTNDVPIMVRKMLYSLHNLYRCTGGLKSRGLKINYNVTYNHIISLPAPQIMFVMSRLSS